MEKVLYHISYDRLWKLLIDKHMMKKDLQKITSLSSNVITKMGKGESVTLETLAAMWVFGYRRNQMGEVIKWQTSQKKQLKPLL